MLLLAFFMQNATAVSFTGQQCEQPQPGSAMAGWSAGEEACMSSVCCKMWRAGAARAARKRGKQGQEAWTGIWMRYVGARSFFVATYNICLVQ